MQFVDLDFLSRDQVTEKFNDNVRYLTSKYTSNKGKVNEIHPSDRTIIEYRVNNMMKKTDKNIHLILNNIEKMKIGANKKYQISGYHEWKILNKKLSYIPNIKYELITDDNLTKNVVDVIIGRYISGCCNECDGRMNFVEKKVPVLYIDVKKV